MPCGKYSARYATNEVTAPPSAHIRHGAAADNATVSAPGPPAIDHGYEQSSQDRPNREGELGAWIHPQTQAAEEARREIST